MKTTGDLRKELASCFKDARSGKLSGDAVRGVVGCANQINISLATEIKWRMHLAKCGEETVGLGEMPISGTKAKP